jgi:hypothetical protein
MNRVINACNAAMSMHFVSHRTMKQFDERPLMAYKNGELLILNAEGKTVTMDGEKPTKKLTK